MLLTHRDIKIMKFINEFGFCEIIQIEKEFKLKKPRSYQIMRRLMDEELVEHIIIFHREHGIFHLTAKGAKYTDLPKIRSIPKDNYEHQLAIIDIYFKMKEQYPEAIWLGERRLKSDKYMKGLGKRGHIADGMLLFPDNKEIAIEVELTMKSKRRLREIFSNYIRCYSIREVWYFCPPNIADRISKLTEEMRRLIKVHSLNVSV